MLIHNIKITNFKSIYGVKEFDFDSLKGMVKLSGSIGAGKTSIGEALIYGLYGGVNGQNVVDLVSWGCKNCFIEINLTSKGHDIFIRRESGVDRSRNTELTVTMDGTAVSASNKNELQKILENDIYDTPKLAMLKMCVISFNQFGSVANMTPAETRNFLDDIFGFKLFTQYSDIISEKVKKTDSLNIQAISVRDDSDEQVKKLRQELDSVKDSNDEDFQKEYNENIQKLLDRKKVLEDNISNLETEMSGSLSGVNSDIAGIDKEISENTALGKQSKKYYNLLKTGVCPVCRQSVKSDEIDRYKNDILKYADIIRDLQNRLNVKKQEKSDIVNKYNDKISEYRDSIRQADSDINNLKIKLSGHLSAAKNTVDMYNKRINELTEKINILNDNIAVYEKDITEWNELKELFTKTLRYNFLKKIIPQINVSVQRFINRLGQPYFVSFDEEFKCHIYIDGYDNEVKYNSLSTGQKKTVDLAIILGILHNIVTNINYNVLFFDELFSNMDVNQRNCVLELFNETIDKDITVFVINHAEMSDDYFQHKIRVSLKQKNIDTGKKKMIISASEYENVF